MIDGIGIQMHKWATELFPLNRSLTGDGVRQTLKYIKLVLPNLEIHEVPSGTRAFDWKVPNEWTIREGYIADLNGNKLIDHSKNNLHVMGYSASINRIMNKDELEKYLYTIPEIPNAIPYVTSYYSKNFGFCLSDNQKSTLGNGPFKVVIDSTLKPGSMTYGELYIPGDSEKEIFFSTYVCHPSMANNELSGPVVAMALAQYLMSLEKRKFSYRFLFTVETIGSIYYISKNLMNMKKNIFAGWVMTCLGDEKNYSYVPSRLGNTMSDKISQQVLQNLSQGFNKYSWLDRGSDERQYCSPGIDLPFSSLMRTKYGEFSEYHTSLDDLNFITPEGLLGGLNMYLNVVEILEKNEYWKINTLCEPHLSKRGLYPTIGNETVPLLSQYRDMWNILSYLDGKHDLKEISDLCKVDFYQVLEIIKKLSEANLIIKI
jgi:aminopeptidase-like protein